MTDQPSFLGFPLSAEEKEILALTHEVCRRELLPIRAQLDEDEAFPEQVLAKFRDIGLFGAMFPAAYGGVGVRRFLPALIAETMAEYCLGVTTTVMASAVLGAGAIEFGGTEEQKGRYLPAIARGDCLCAFAFTEPEAGSDAFNLSTRAVPSGDGYVLNGTKQWITNAGQADVYCIFALTRTDCDPRGGISCFLVERDSPGLSFGKLERKLGIRCSHTRQVVLDNVEVSVDNLVGGVPHRGFVQAFQSLTRSRACLAAAAVGLATAAYREAVHYALNRRQFGKKIIHFQALQHTLAEMVVKIDSARLLAYRAVEAFRAGHPDAATYAAMAKYHASEIAMQVATDALQMHGGYGFTKDYPIEKMFRDAKILAIYEGTSQMMKTQIAMHVVKEGTRRG